MNLRICCGIVAFSLAPQRIARIRTQTHTEAQARAHSKPIALRARNAFKRLAMRYTVHIWIMYTWFHWYLHTTALIRCNLVGAKINFYPKMRCHGKCVFALWLASIGIRFLFRLWSLVGFVHVFVHSFVNLIEKYGAKYNSKVEPKNCFDCIGDRFDSLHVCTTMWKIGEVQSHVLTALLLIGCVICIKKKREKRNEKQNAKKKTNRISDWLNGDWDSFTALTGYKLTTNLLERNWIFLVIFFFSTISLQSTPSTKCSLFRNTNAVIYFLAS